MMTWRIIERWIDFPSIDELTYHLGWIDFPSIDDLTYHLQTQPNTEHVLGWAAQEIMIYITKYKNTTEYYTENTLATKKRHFVS